LDFYDAVTPAWKIHGLSHKALYIFVDFLIIFLTILAKNPRKLRTCWISPGKENPSINCVLSIEISNGNSAV